MATFSKSYKVEVVELDISQNISNEIPRSCSSVTSSKDNAPRIKDAVVKVVEILGCACKTLPKSAALPSFRQMSVLKRHIQRCQIRCHGKCSSCRRLAALNVIFNNTDEQPEDTVNFERLVHRMNCIRRWFSLHRFATADRSITYVSVNALAKKTTQTKCDSSIRVPLTAQTHFRTKTGEPEPNYVLLNALKTSSVVFKFRNLQHITLPKCDEDLDDSNRGSVETLTDDVPSVDIMDQFLSLWAIPSNERRDRALNQLLNEYPSLKRINTHMEESMIGRQPLKRVLIKDSNIKFRRPILRFLDQEHFRENLGVAETYAYYHRSIYDNLGGSLDDMDSDSFSTISNFEKLSPESSLESPGDSDESSGSPKVYLIEVHKYADLILKLLELFITREKRISKKSNDSVHLIKLLDEVRLNIQFIAIIGHIIPVFSKDICDICDAFTDGVIPTKDINTKFQRTLLYVYNHIKRFKPTTGVAIEVIFCEKHSNYKTAYEDVIFKATMGELLRRFYKRLLYMEKKSNSAEDKAAMLALLEKAESKFLVCPIEMENMSDCKSESSCSEMGSDTESMSDKSTLTNRPNQQPIRNDLTKTSNKKTKMRQKKHARGVYQTRKERIVTREITQVTVKSPRKNDSKLIHNKDFHLCCKHRASKVKLVKGVKTKKPDRKFSINPVCLSSGPFTDDIFTRFPLPLEVCNKFRDTLVCEHMKHKTLSVRYLFEPDWYADLDFSVRLKLDVIIKRKDPFHDCKLDVKRDLSHERVGRLIKAYLSVEPFTAEVHRIILILLLTNKELLNVVYWTVVTQQKKETFMRTALNKLIHKSASVLYEQPILMEALGTTVQSTESSEWNAHAIEMVYAAIIKLSLRKNATSPETIVIENPVTDSKVSETVTYVRTTKPVQELQSNLVAPFYPNDIHAQLRLDIFEHYLLRMSLVNSGFPCENNYNEETGEFELTETEEQSEPDQQIYDDPISIAAITFFCGNKIS